VFERLEDPVGNVTFAVRIVAIFRSRSHIVALKLVVLGLVVVVDAVD
jgi:hypothetical protein